MNCEYVLLGTTLQEIKNTNPDEHMEIMHVVQKVSWKPVKEYNNLKHQAAYNRIFQNEFTSLGWESEPLVSSQCGQKADLGKNRIHIEVEFGNYAKIYHCYYKFQVSFEAGIIDLAVLIVPGIRPSEFFPERKSKTSVSSMADYSTAIRYLSLLKEPLPLWIIGLRP